MLQAIKRFWLRVFAINLLMFFFQAIVFVVGGGNYIEYQNLVDYTKVL